MPRPRQLRNNVEASLALSLLPLAALSQTPVALAVCTAPTIYARGFKRGRVFQSKNNYRFRYESALIYNYHVVLLPRRHPSDWLNRTRQPAVQ